MAVDVSRIPNNNKFDPVREAILQLQSDVQSGVSGVGSINGQDGLITIVDSGNITVNTVGTTITIGIDDSTYLTEEVNDLTQSVTWTNVPDANITQSSVTQHQAALSITESQISDLQSYLVASDLDDYLLLTETGTQTIVGNIVIEGDLTTSGSITYINSTHLDIGDNIIKLNADITSTTAPTEDAGFYVNRGSSPDVSFLWDEQDDRFSTYTSALSTASLYIGSNQVINSSRQFLGSSTISSTVPYFTFSGDSNTGVGRATNNKVSLIAEGTKVLEAGDTGVDITGTLDVSGAITGNGIVLTDDIITSADFSATDNRFKLTLTQADAGTIEASFDDVVLSESMAADYIPYVKVGGGDGDTTNAVLNDSFLKINGSTLELDWGDTVGVYTARDIKMRKDGGGFGTYYEATYAADSVSFLHYASASDIDTAKIGATTAGRIRINDTYSLPVGDGTSGQVLSTNGSGDLSWVAAGGNATLLEALDDYVWNASTNGRDFNLGIQASFVSSGQSYPQFGSVVRIATYSGINDGGTAELYFPYSATYGGSSMRYRLGKYNNAGWTGWKTVIDSDNIGSQSVANADTVDNKHAADFTLDYVTGNNATTTNNISIGSLSATGASFTDPVTIYDNSSSENPRLSVGRGSTERLKFDVEDRVARITHQQDEGTGGHEMWFTIDSPTTSISSKIFYWAERAVDGSSSNTLMTVSSNGLDLINNLYTRSNLNVLNAAGTGWNTWATRSGGNYNLNIGSLTVGGTTTTSDIYAQGSQVWSETTQGLTIGTIHIDPATGTDHAGGAITWGASDAANGTNAQAGIYVRSDGNYGTKMYFSTTDSYATGSKTAMSIDQTGLITINPRLDSTKSFRVYYDMDVYNTVNFTDTSWNIQGKIWGAGGNVYIRSQSGDEWRFDDNAYTYVPSWINIGSGGGIFSSTNGAHFYPNTYSNYGTWRIDGDRGGYSGILVNDVTNKPHIMYDNSGNGGLYNEGNGVWPVYYHVGNDCVAIGGSATSSAYKARVNGDMRTDGSLEVADSTNSAILGAASFSWQGNTAFPTLYSSNPQRWVMICNPHVPYLENGTNGYTGSTAGSVIGFASNASSSTTYWGLGINPQGIGAQDMFSITRANSTRVLDITSAGNMQITGGFAHSGSRRILFPAGGSLEGSSSQTGAIKIGLPTARYGANTMMTFKVVIYEYTTGETYEFRIGGYTYSDHAWRNVSCIQISDQAPRHQVRWGNDGSRECVWIGETNTGWAYPQVEVMDVTCGFSGESLDGWADGWSLSFVSSFNTVTQTRTPARLGYNINAATIDLDAGSAYPIEVNSSQRYQIGFQNTGTSESTNYPFLAHEYASKTTGAYSSMIVHFNGIGDRFWFNRVGDFEADRDIVNNGWYYNRSSSGMYWPSYGYGFRSAHGQGNSYGNVSTYNAGKNSWDGWSLGRNDMSYMGQTNNMGLYAAGVGDWAFYYYQPNRGVGLMTSTTSSTYEVYVGGDLYATGDIVAYSDRRVKENIINIDSALDKVKALQGVYYNRINDKDKVREIGFIAQDVHEAVPELASYAEDVDEWGVKYSQVTGLHNEAIKELAQELDKKDEQIANLQAQIDELKQLILNK